MVPIYVEFLEQMKMLDVGVNYWVGDIPIKGVTRGQKETDGDKTVRFLDFFFRKVPRISLEIVHESAKSRIPP